MKIKKRFQILPHLAFGPINYEGKPCPTKESFDLLGKRGVNFLDKEINSEELKAGNMDKLHDEIGDLLFTAIIFAAYKGLDPETALKSCNDKFEKRFQYMYDKLTSDGVYFSSASYQQRLDGWHAAKNAGL